MRGEEDGGGQAGHSTHCGDIFVQSPAWWWSRALDDEDDADFRWCKARSPSALRLSTETDMQRQVEWESGCCKLDRCLRTYRRKGRGDAMGALGGHARSGTWCPQNEKGTAVEKLADSGQSVSS